HCQFAYHDLTRFATVNIAPRANSIMLHHFSCFDLSLL
ncbi:MAG: hypothetical protein ACI85H_001591, partial [Paracoccaceae bacterium]